MEGDEGIKKGYRTQTSHALVGVRRGKKLGQLVDLTKTPLTKTQSSPMSIYTVV